MLDHWADGDLGVGEQAFDRVGQQMRGGMANHFQAVGVLGGDDGQGAVGADGVAGIDHDAVDLARQGRFGQSCANRCGHLGHGDRAGEFAQRAVGECDLNHGHKAISAAGAALEVG